MKVSKTTIKVLQTILFPLIAVAVVLLVWQIAAAVTNSQLILPTPASTLKELLRYFTVPEFYSSLILTTLSSIAAFILAVALSILTAALAFLCKPLKLFLKTTVSIIRSVPTISIILLLIIWTNSKIAPIIVALLVIYPSLYSSIVAAVELIDPSLEETAKIYAVPLWQKIFKIYIPLAAPNYLSNAASAISLNLKLIVAAEVLSQTVGGIGLMMQQAQTYFETGRLLALTVAVIVVAALLEGLVGLVKKLTCKW